jgi:hypothetical protein
MKLNDALSRIPWQDFEILVANRYRRHGWQVAHCSYGPGERAAGEVDLRMEKQGDLALVQCRHESLSRLDTRTIERLLAQAADEAATEVIIIASGDVPEDARQLAESAGATIVEGAAVRDMLDDDLLDLRPASQSAGVEARRERANIVTQGKLPRQGRRGWNLPLFLAALAFLGLLMLYGATFARYGMEHPLPPQVDPAVLSRGAGGTSTTR